MLTPAQYERMHVLVQGLPPNALTCLPTPDEIVSEVCGFFRLSEKTVRSRQRTMYVTWCRQVCCYLIVDCIGVSSSEAGASVGISDHTTVLSNKRRVKAMLQTDERKAAQVRDIKARIEAKWPAVILHRSTPKPAPVSFEEEFVGYVDKAEDEERVLTIDERIAIHQKRIAAETAKFVPPTIIEAITLGRAAIPEGPQGVYNTIAQAFRLRRAAISSNRRAVVSTCRCAIVFVLREMGLSYPEIAECVGQTSHSSTIGSYKRAVRLLAEAA